MIFRPSSVKDCSKWQSIFYICNGLLFQQHHGYKSKAQLNPVSENAFIEVNIRGPVVLHFVYLSFGVRSEHQSNPMHDFRMILGQRTRRKNADSIDKVI